MAEYATKEEAVAGIFADSAARPEMEAEGYTIVICAGADLCGRRDPTAEEIEACTKCERMFIPPIRKA